MGPYGTSNGYIVYTLNCQELQVDNANNRSLVKCWMDCWRTNTGYSTHGTGTAYIRINGALYSNGISNNQYITNTPIRLVEAQAWVGHNDDGSYNMPLSGFISHNQFSSSEQGGTVPLTNIPRQAIMGYVNGTLITDTFSYNYKSNTSIYWYRARISVPGNLLIMYQNLGQFSGDASSTFKFTTAQLTSILNVCTPQHNGCTIGVVLETHTDSSYTSKLGETGEAMVNVGFPTTISIPIPTPRDSATAITAITGNNNYIVQNKSNLTVIVGTATTSDCASTSNPAVIVKYEVTVNGQTKILTAPGTLDFGVITSSANITGTIKVTDSRNNVASKTFAVNVIPYTPPTIKITECYRSNSNGIENATTGTYAYVVVAYSICSIKILGIEKNVVKNRSLLIDGISKSTSFVSGSGYTYGTISIASHTIVANVTDLFLQSSSYSYSLGSATLPFVIKANKKSFGIGGEPTADDQFYVGFSSINVQGNMQPIMKIASNLISPVNTNYLIANTAVEGFVYSTTEKWTGDYWIDGRKIYTKTTAVNFGQATTTTSHGIANLDFVVNCIIGWCDTVDGAYYQAPREDGGNIYVRLQKVTASAIYISCSGTDWQPRTKDRYAILKYVKKV